MHFHPYLTFNGNCADAMRFYEKTLGGKMQMMLTYGESPDPAQCPAGSGPDIETNEFFVIPTDALRDHNGDGVFDRVDPQMGFDLQSFSLAGSNALLNWSAMPGRTYRVTSAVSPVGPWTDVLASQTNAGPLQLNLNYGDTFNPGTTQKFYRIKLLP